MKIALLGYMGSGKSAVGKSLAERLGIPFFDLDALIEADLGAKIREVFDAKGEIFFRKAESRVLNEFLAHHEAFILATGGGTPCYGRNLEDLHDAGVTTIYLQVGISVLANRLRSEKEERPLIQHLNDTDLIEFIGKHIFERSAFYNQAQRALPVGEKSVLEVVEAIEAGLSEEDGGVAG